MAEIVADSAAASGGDESTILRLKGVTAGYGAGLILKGVDLTVPTGTIVCLIGPNGAGKSTVLKTISGLLRPEDGQVLFRGEDISRLSSRERLDRGVVHVPQDRSLFPGMSVWENVVMGAFILKDQALIRSRMEQVSTLFPIVAERKNAAAGSLSGGEQKQVELARSLMLDPALILLDEPSIGLDPKARKSVFESITQLAADGRSVLLVEQNARSGLAVAHHAAVLEAGRVALTGTGEQLLTDPEVARLYLGANAVAAVSTDSPSESAPQG
ncbi:ABC transporter ATP-binding protein [Demequina lutea]|uniref:Branched-chain amino acid transport system ATP-binding protein n=1 Tax=Demequina lutea TaxID=431489 RepID=A0A7Y9Z7E9_9MICO|nr:ABC transporter ATP-binding protein [Demequina lutea]NYI40194.1 branched-chain amino acid transport system ATP-binding protein [Demequina lutea]